MTKSINDDKEKIFTDEELIKKFNEIDKKIQNVELRKFRDYLFNNQEILPELKNYKKLQKNIWVSYLVEKRDLFEKCLEQYKLNKTIIIDAIQKAREEQTDWENVVSTFNRRFFVPFQVLVTNQEDVILKGTQPSIGFKFTDGRGESDVPRESLLRVLSQGEKRALYILNILFEIESRMKLKTKTILIVDDIADSFDYKNKYAIIEYLQEICLSKNFYCIFLSHNYDFYRSLSGRLNLKRECKLMANRSEGQLVLTQEKYQNNPFLYWKNNIQTPSYYISSIPFVRNLAEYCGHNDEYLKLTALLHIKAESHQLTLGMLEEIYKKVLVDKAQLNLVPKNKKVIDVIFEEADEIVANNEEHIQLENKIVISIAIRLLAEQYMIDKISDIDFVDKISKNQTIELLKKYKVMNLGTPEEVQLLEQVNLMTPENIHLNSFMFEPIIDMGSSHLKELYIKIQSLKNNS